MKHTTLRLPEAEYAELERLAEVNERKVAAEIRMAIRAWIATTKQTKEASR